METSSRPEVTSPRHVPTPLSWPSGTDPLTQKTSRSLSSRKPLPWELTSGVAYKGHSSLVRTLRTAPSLVPVPVYPVLSTDLEPPTSRWRSRDSL